MVSLRQIERKGRKRKIKEKGMGQPFKKGVCIKVLLRKPKKPNSAQRKVVK